MPGRSSRTACSSYEAWPSATHPDSQRRSAVGTLALLAAAACIGAGAIAVRAAYARGSEPSSLVVVRFGGAGLLFCLALPWLVASAPRPLPWRGLALAALAGLTLLAGAHAEFEGLDRLPAAVLILLLFIAPIWVAMIERVVWGRRVTRATVAAIALVIVGVATMVAPWNVEVDLLGVCFGVLGSVALAGFFVLIDRSQLTVPTALGISTGLVAAGLVSVLLDPGAVGEELGRPGVLPYALGVAGSLASWGLLATVGLHATSAVTAAIVSAAEPVFVALLAFLLLGESLSPLEITGGAIVMGGVLLASLTSAPRERDTPPQAGAGRGCAKPAGS